VENSHCAVGEEEENIHFMFTCWYWDLRCGRCDSDGIRFRFYKTEDGSEWWYIEQSPAERKPPRFRTFSFFRVRNICFILYIY
jgi:hypothetical protein